MRAVAVTELALRSEHLVERALATAEFTHLVRDPRFYSRTVSALREMRAADISQFAYKYLNRERARMLYVAPLGPRAPPASGLVGVGAGDELTASDDDEDTHDSEAIAWIARRPGVGALRTVRLRTGVDLVIGGRAAGPVVVVGLALPVGTVHGSATGAADLADLVAQPGQSEHGSPLDFGARTVDQIGLD